MEGRCTGLCNVFLEKFTEAAPSALDSTNIVIGTIPLGGDEFIQTIKQDDVVQRI